MDSLKNIDFYPKLSDEVRVKTFSGAAVSIVATLTMLLLFFSQLSAFLTTETTDHLEVDTSAMNSQLQIQFDIEFPSLPCELVTMQAMDVAGSNQVDLDHSIMKAHLVDGVQTGKPFQYHLGHDVPLFGPGSALSSFATSTELSCGSCYGTELSSSDCCNSCDELRTRYARKRWEMPDLSTIPQCALDNVAKLNKLLDSKHGCRIYGFYKVNKVAGNFHFVPGRSRDSAVHLAQTLYKNGGGNVAGSAHDIDATNIDVTHTIRRFLYGQNYPKMVNPLDQVSKPAPQSSNQVTRRSMYMYYTKVVPTQYYRLEGDIIDTNQFAVTEHVRRVSINGKSDTLTTANAASSPGIFFFYELAPILVKVTEHRQAFLHFLTQICAIVGGVFTVAGLVDRFIYASIKHVQNKIEIGKFN